MIVIEVKFKFVSLSNVRCVELVIFVSFFIVLQEVKSKVNQGIKSSSQIDKNKLNALI